LIKTSRWWWIPVLLGYALPGWAQAEEGADYNVHFQATGIYQATPTFHSPFQGPNSLSGNTQLRETLSATGFFGRRLWEGAEFYVDPELNQGFGLNESLGVAGFPNGEAQKVGSRAPSPNLARGYLRQVWGLGGAEETLPDDLNQIGGTVDISRVTLILGKFAAPDFFDDNLYSHDPRTTFLNWSLWESSAWDYPADQKGYTEGAVLELNQQDWALRGGWLFEPTTANGNDLDLHFWQHFGAVVELETRHEIMGEPGRLHFLFFANRAHLGDLQEAANLARLSETPAAIAGTRRDRFKLGAAFTVEQALNGDLGAFARFSWNDGRTEDWAFTDIDDSAAAGLSLKGTGWARPQDTVGLAGAVNLLSNAHRDFFAAGGTGILIGDGRLDYAPETILETYYGLGLTAATTLTLDYQFVLNPAYDAARGPVSIFGVRLHTQF